jgi:ketosteroid isomerase-like protein
LLNQTIELDMLKTMSIKRFIRLCARSRSGAYGILFLAGLSCSRADSGGSEESSGAAAAEGGAAEARDAIETVLADQAEAWNRGDLEGFMAGYWRSPELTYTAGGRVHRGWEQLLDRYRRAYGEGDALGRLSFDDLEVHPLSADAAWALGRWRLELEADTLGGAYTLVLREVEGQWRIVHDHTSTDAPPAAPESAP